MLEPHQLHQPDCDLAVVRWSRMVRSACRQLVLEPSTAYAVRVSAVFDDERAAIGAAEVVAGIVAEHALVADVSFGRAVSARIARPVLEDARSRSIASGPATTSQRDGPGFGLPSRLRTLLGR